jgi:hypothetical protein
MSYPREGKLYALKSSANRAAKQDGLVEGQFELVQKGDEWMYKTKASHQTVKEQIEPQLEKKAAEDAIVEKKKSPIGRPRTAADAPPPMKKKSAVDLQMEQDLKEAAAKREEEKRRLEEEAKNKPAPVLTAVVHNPEVPAVVRSATSTTEATPRVMKVITGGKAKIVKDRVNRSSIESPTKAVWYIADEMVAANPNVARKTVIEECVKRGIAFFTARTQYQQWLTAKRESEANAEKANKKK